LSLALDAFEADTELVKAVGEELVGQFVAIKRSEWDKFTAAVTDWELKYYLPFL
jgi:glutamine synthetase